MPRDLLPHILSFDSSIVHRHGVYMNRLSPSDPRYDMLRRRRTPIWSFHPPTTRFRGVVHVPRGILEIYRDPEFVLELGGNANHEYGFSMMVYSDGAFHRSYDYTW